MTRPVIIMNYKPVRPSECAHWNEPWFNRPIVPNWDGYSPDCMRHTYREMAEVARVDVIAPLTRGIHNPAWEFIARVPWRKVVESYQLSAGTPAPRMSIWFDTGAWPDYTGNLFDCANRSHWMRVWEDHVRPMLEELDDQRPTSAVNPLRWYRVADGRILLAFWAIASGLRFTNQHHCGDLMRFLQVRASSIGFEFVPLVDRSWCDGDPDGPWHAVNDWFEGSGGPSHTLRTHTNGISCGMLVPGFRDPSAPERRIDRRGGATLREGLAACKDADYILCESHENGEEDAHFWTTEAYGTRELESLRASREQPIDQILDCSLLPGPNGQRDDFYTMKLRVGGPAIRAAIAGEYQRMTGHPPAETDIDHNEYRAFEVWETPVLKHRHFPFATLRDAIWDRVRPFPKEERQ